jgi:DNA modification methylase
MNHTIQQLSPDQLQPWRRNSRTHSKKQVRQIANSIRRFGFTNPVLIDGEKRILAGHGRVEAAMLLGQATVPCLRIDHLTEDEKRAYVIADNKLAMNAGWDEELLALELQELSGLSFDISLTGFTIAEVDGLIEGLAPEEPGDPEEDRLPRSGTQAKRCRPGDLWALGPHRLYCGNALDPATLEILMAGDRADMIFTDPPYNVPIAGHVSGKGAIKHREFAMASGEMSREAFTTFLQRSFAGLARHSKDGSIHFVCMDWRHIAEITAAGEAVYDELKNVIVWAKDNGGMGTFYRSRHELIFAFKNGSAPHHNSFELGQHGRYRTNVWEYRGVNTLKSGRNDELALHPTVKPVAMIADAIKDVTPRSAVVLDVFGGSGSTLIAAHKTGRRARVVELDPVYCDRILTRWEAYAKDEAECLACGVNLQAAGTPLELDSGAQLSAGPRPC